MFLSSKEKFGWECSLVVENLPSMPRHTHTRTFKKRELWSLIPPLNMFIIATIKYRVRNLRKYLL